jgi:lysophospholipase L1-like esterase
MTKKIRVEYVVFLVSISIFFVIFFIVERALQKISPHLIYHISKTDQASAGKFLEYDYRLGRFHRKNISGLLLGKKVSINKQRIRNKNIAYTRDPLRKRIVCLGDSVSWGYGVNDDETFCVNLEKLLQNTDVINMGVPGYCTGDELLLYQYEGYKYNPDIVMLCFFMGNDIVENNLDSTLMKSYPMNFFSLRDKKLIIERFHIGVAKTMAYWFYEHSYVVNFLGSLCHPYKRDTKDVTDTHSWVYEYNEKRWLNLGATFYRHPPFTYLETPPGLKEYRNYTGWLRPVKRCYYAVELTKQLLLAFKSDVRAHNTQFIVVFFPSSIQLALTEQNPDYANRAQTELMKFCANNRISYFDLCAAFLERHINANDIFIDSGHLTPYGHSIVAHILKDHVIARIKRISPLTK